MMKPILKFTLALLVFAVISCSKTKPVVQIIPVKKPVLQLAAISTPGPREEPYILFLKKTLPRIPPDVGYAHVQSILKLNEKFNGLIFSSGTKNNFCYTFELGTYQLDLTFDYTHAKDGAFKSFLLTPVS